MRFVLAFVVCSLIGSALAGPLTSKNDDDSCGKDSLFKAKKQRADSNPLQCIKCELVIQVFHFINDAIIGGEGEEAAKQKVLEFCKTAPSFFKKFCDDVKNGNLWDIIYKALRDSLATFYCIVGVGWFDCPSLADLKQNCGGF